MTDHGMPDWVLERRTLEIGGQQRTVRMTRFARGWIASVDTLDGPTLGVDRSPYIALGRALDPLGVPLTTALLSPLPTPLGAGGIER